MLWVSIRSRLFGREKLSGEAFLDSSSACFNPLPAFRPGETADIKRSASDVKFQSAPGFSAGRNETEQAKVPSGWRFQSAPGFSAGRNEIEARGGTRYNVSIRSRLFGREKPKPLPSFGVEGGVSIRSRLFGREKRSGSGVSSPRPPGFNPLPAFRPGETLTRRSFGLAALVSIRSRLFGREKQFDHKSRLGT